MNSFKKWDCLEHKWKWFWMPVHQPLHNAWWYQYKFYPLKNPSKLGEVWQMVLRIPLKYVPPNEYPWNKEK